MCFIKNPYSSLNEEIYIGNSITESECHAGLTSELLLPGEHEEIKISNITEFGMGFVFWVHKVLNLC